MNEVIIRREVRPGKGIFYVMCFYTDGRLVAKQDIIDSYSKRDELINYLVDHLEKEK